jgi:hypothetical protein
MISWQILRETNDWRDRTVEVRDWRSETLVGGNSGHICCDDGDEA